MITIPFHQHTGYVGGIVTFMHNLREYLDRQGYAYTTSEAAPAVIFFPMSHPAASLTLIKKSGGKIIQRLDGVYYPEKHPDAYEALNQGMKEAYTRYADFIIFQSEYSKAQCFAMFGEKPKDTYQIVVNGVDKQIFFPDASVTPGSEEPIRFVTTGSFRNLDMLEPVIQAMDELVGNLHLKLVVVGPVLEDQLKPYLQRAYVEYAGQKNTSEIAGILRKCHVFIYAHLNPPCPNSVVEAVSSGLPVVGFDSGAMRELCYFAQDLFAYVSDDIFQQYKDFDHRKLQEKIIQVVQNYAQYRQQALAHSHLYSFEETGAAYRQVFDQVSVQAEKTFDPTKYKRLARRQQAVSLLQRSYASFKHQLKKITKP